MATLGWADHIVESMLAVLVAGSLTVEPDQLASTRHPLGQSVDGLCPSYTSVVDR